MIFFLPLLVYFESSPFFCFNSFLTEQNIKCTQSKFEINFEASIYFKAQCMHERNYYLSIFKMTYFVYNVFILQISENKKWQ